MGFPPSMRAGRSRSRARCAAYAAVAWLLLSSAHGGTPPTPPEKPVSRDASIAVAPEWLRAYEQRLEVNRRWGRVPESVRVRIEADYATNARDWRVLMEAAYALTARVRAHADAVAAYERRNGEFSAAVVAFNARCAQPSSIEDQRRCEADRDALLRRQQDLESERQALVRSGAALQSEVDAHNGRSRAWATGPLGSLNQLLADAIAAASRPIDDAERRALEAERTRLRAEVAGYQDALRRLEKQRETEEGDRAEWERRMSEATASANKRVVDVLTDTAVDAGLGLLASKAKSISGEIDKTLALRIEAAGAKAPDKERVKALDETLRGLFADRSEIRACIERIDEGKLRLQQVLAGLQSKTAEDRQEALEAASEALSALLSDPRVQKGLKISGAYAQFATYAKLTADSAVDVANEVTAIVRVRALNEAADRYLADVKRLDALLRERADRIREINQTIGTGP